MSGYICSSRLSNNHYNKLTRRGGRPDFPLSEAFVGAAWVDSVRLVRWCNRYLRDNNSVMKDGMPIPG
jgi:hypothetical protein